MGRLFWKIFLWFWFTLILIGAGVSWGTAIYVQNSEKLQQRDYRSRFISSRVELVRQVLRYGGSEAVSDILKNRKVGLRRVQIFVVNKNNQEILGRTFDKNTAGFKQYPPVKTIDGEIYSVFSIQRPRAKKSTLSRMLRPFKRSPAIYLLWLGIALALSSLVCFWLARYMSKPIRTLQSATKKFSQGDLDTRVAGLIGNRRDEIADLGQDFDKMASRLQSLINNQKQLLSDISHELRSPLARMQVAIGLAKNKTGGDVAIEMLRIEQETNRLDDLIGQSLTLSRLNAGAVYPKDDFIDIGKLLEDIVVDCNFEANDKDKKVVFKYEQTWTINANVELLRRALENIIRNAVHYTASATTVEVSLYKNHPNTFKISICDQGKGAPAEKLDSLFEPFVRLSEARDRDSGGYGLGLAIAKRAIEFHQGNITARNRKTNGLCVDITLPLEVSAETIT